MGERLLQLHILFFYGCPYCALPFHCTYLCVYCMCSFMQFYFYMYYNLAASWCNKRWRYCIANANQI